MAKSSQRGKKTEIMKTTTDELRTRIAAIDGRKIELSGERDEIAYKAHIECDVKAAKRLAEINTEFGHLENEIASLSAALAEAGRRAEAATAAEAAETERKRAEQAVPIVRRLEERGAKMDVAIQSYCEHFAAIQADLDELARLGAPTPSRALVEVNGHRAHDSALTALGDKFVRPVPPLQRHSFDQLLTGWALPAQRWIESKLNNAAKAA
jgi:hypothetical protein